MATYESLNEFLQEAERDLQKLEADKSYCLDLYKSMQQHIDLCLGTKQYESLFDLFPYFEEPDSYPQFHNSSETKRIHILLNILKLELKYEKTPFLSTANDYNGIMAQYLMTIFAMRRLELALSEEAMAEAATYLTSVPLTIYAAMFISQNEYFENYENLFWNLYTCMKSIWPIGDKIQWLTWLFEREPVQQATLELASLYMEVHNYSRAYQYLTAIPSPSKDIVALISSLKELL
ncbi:MAG: hypothetical protein HDR01_16235 [Lachnospiraceae bacterium]|nr:hypothetical protein [Lachnospiraceae bacterium]